jgi:hypothetical protein
MYSSGTRMTDSFGTVEWLETESDDHGSDCSTASFPLSYTPAFHLMLGLAWEVMLSISTVFSHLDLPYATVQRTASSTKVLMRFAAGLSWGDSQTNIDTQVRRRGSIHIVDMP